MQIDNLPERYLVVWQDLTTSAFRAQRADRLGLALLHKKVLRAVRDACGVAVAADELLALEAWLGNVARVSGDSFAVLDSQCASETIARVVAL